MFSHFIPAIRALILDLDGVLWRGHEPIGNLADIFAAIDERGLKAVLCTNNAARPLETVQERLAGFGVQIERSQIITSAMSAAYLLKKQHPDGGPVFIVGEAGLQMALAEEGFYQADEKVLAVVAGLDRHITYEKLRTASRLIRSGAPFIGTNPDLTYPDSDGLSPGAGSILAAIQAATGVEPIICGKPMPTMFDQAIELLGIRPQEGLVVGDRLDTDILGGQRAGCRTALVFSGVSRPEDLNGHIPAPDLSAPSLAHLLLETI